MLAAISLNATTVLWLGGSVIGFLILTGSMNRRRQGLTDVLKDFIERKGHKASESVDAKTTSNNNDTDSDT